MPILKRHKVTVEPVKVYQAYDVKKIRNSTGMSQKIFASYMGVSDKTVEAWEAGTKSSIRIYKQTFQHD